MIQLATPADRHYREMMGWFPDARSCEVWATRDFRFPFTEASFREDIRPALPSWVLLDAQGALLGFGQYYLRVGRCHLARLIVAPQHRGRAHGAGLVRLLARRGCAELAVDECSLFVLSDNLPACGLYRRLGFVETPYPGEAPAIEHCIYMTAALAALAA